MKYCTAAALALCLAANGVAPAPAQAESQGMLNHYKGMHGEHRHVAGHQRRGDIAEGAAKVHGQTSFPRQAGPGAAPPDNAVKLAVDGAGLNGVLTNAGLAGVTDKTNLQGVTDVTGLTDANAVGVDAAASKKKKKGKKGPKPKKTAEIKKEIEMAKDKAKDKASDATAKAEDAKKPEGGDDKMKPEGGDDKMGDDKMKSEGGDDDKAQKAKAAAQLSGGSEKEKLELLNTVDQTVNNIGLAETLKILKAKGKGGK